MSIISARVRSRPVASVTITRYRSGATAPTGGCSRPSAPSVHPTAVNAAAKSLPDIGFRTRNPLTDSDLAAALTEVGCTLDRDGRWHPPGGVKAPDRYRMIVGLAAGRDLTRAEMITILLTAGYRESSATGRMSSSHPLFRRIGPDRYRLIGDAQPGGSIGLVGG